MRTDKYTHKGLNFVIFFGKIAKLNTQAFEKMLVCEI